MRCSDEADHVSPAEIEYCRSHDLPLPTVAARERLRCMLSFRNSMHLHHTTCALTGEKILSSTSPRSGLVVYDIEAWSSDRWDAARYGRAYDFSRPFFEQFADLMRAVPFPSLGVIRSTMENSDYTNDITGAKNCYLLFGATENESCLFSHWLWRNRDVVDSIHVFDSELCYECRDVRNCYHLLFADHCIGCSDSAFLSHCTQCSECYACVNLRQKRFCMHNEQLSEAQYRARRAAVDLGSFAVLQREQEEFARFAAPFPAPAVEGSSNENSSGNYLRHTKNCRRCFFVSEAQDCDWCIGVVNAKNCLVQASYGDGSELVYHSTGVGDHAYNIRWSWECWMNVSDLEYCMYCTTGASSCFGCIGLKHRQYCILNREYSRSEYQAILPRIRAHMRANGEYGSFFPARLSPHTYNQSWADHFLPLSQQEALAAGFRWGVDEEKAESVSPLPDHIRDAADAVVSRTFECTRTGKPYRLNRMELEFYRRVGLPLPRVAPLERLRQRARLLSISSLRENRCGRCDKSVTTVQAASTIVCNDCFERLRE